MNILLEFTTLNYRVWHSLAIRLKEIYPEARFAGIVGIAPEGNHVLEFLKEQKDVRYEFLCLRHKLTEEALKGEIDWDVLKEFEERIPEKSIWRIIAADRAWGCDYLHGVILPSSYISEINDRENILRVLSGTIKKFRRMFEEFKVDLFLPAISMGATSVFIFEELCRERKIPYIVPTFTRLDNIFAFASDVHLNFPHIDRLYLDLMDGRRQIDVTRAEKLYQKLMNELEDSRNFDRTMPGMKVVKLTTWRSRFLTFLKMIRAVLGSIPSWIRDRKFNQSDDIRRSSYKLFTLWQNILRKVRFYRQKFILLDPHFGEILPPEQKYIYYPLHTNPEYSTSILGTMWINQLYNIELLSKSIPAEWVVYVKEHPATLPYRVRPWNFFKDILRYPNVRMAPVDLSSHEIVSNAQMVAVVSGTSGWEAVQRGIPVLTLTKNYYDVLGLSLTCTNVENLSREIHEEIARSKAISPAERKKRLVFYLAAILEHSFTISYPNQFYYEPGTIEQYEIVGRETADALKKHLDHLNFKREEALR